MCSLSCKTQLGVLNLVLVSQLTPGDTAVGIASQRAKRLSLLSRQTIQHIGKDAHTATA